MKVILLSVVLALSCIVALNIVLSAQHGDDRNDHYQAEGSAKLQSTGVEG